ncbi:MAG: di-trans,poly-cis-decaprenylcistransferase [Bacteroidetes bacterium]|nr:di-trans,poly-cis-decaprenylcistransferase [Bacteroidota bacterium]
MDGNGRWALKNDLPRFEGHKKGAKTAKCVIKYCLKQKIQYLSLFAFSKENWLRPKKEVDYIMKLLSRSLINEKKFLIENDIKLKVIGDLSNISPSITKLLDQAINDTQNNKGLTLLIALDYTGRWEILEAVKKLSSDISKNNVDINNIDEPQFKNYLQTSDIPDPDLLIRTSGEKRLSNFLLWQLSYTEIFFINELWPDFNETIFNNIILEFKNRERRFGKISEQLNNSSMNT